MELGTLSTGRFGVVIYAPGYGRSIRPRESSFIFKEWPMRKCSYCKRDIACDSNTCPYCGKTDVSAKDRSNDSFWAVLALILFLIALFLGVRV